jgi:hypothetical protein
MLCLDGTTSVNTGTLSADNACYHKRKALQNQTAKSRSLETTVGFPLYFRGQLLKRAGYHLTQPTDTATGYTHNLG